VHEIADRATTALGQKQSLSDVRLAPTAANPTNAGMINAIARFETQEGVTPGRFLGSEKRLS
jgi:hypothetical protein